MPKVIILILTIIVVSLFIIGKKLVDYTFYKTILRKRKTKEDIFKVLEERKAYDTLLYDQLDIEDLEITSEDGLKLKGYFINKFPKSKKLMIIVHGYTSNHYIGLQYLDIFFEEEFNVLMIDVRSHGNSEGNYATYGYYEREDLNQWIDFMTDKLGNDIKIGLHGQSMGAATVLMYGGKYEDKVDFIIADCPYSSGKEILRYQFKQYKGTPLYPLYWFVNRRCKKLCKFDMNDISPIDDIRNKKIPTMFIHGTGDDFVPCYMSEEMYKRKIGDKNKLVLIEGAAHVEAYPKDKIKYSKEVQNFIKEVLK